MGERYYSAILNIKNTERGKLLKDLTQIKDITQGIISSYGTNPKSKSLRNASMDSIAEKREKVNGKFSREETNPTDITAADIETLRSIPRKSINEFTSEDIQKTEKWARKFYSELGVKSPFVRAWFGVWRAQDISPISFVIGSEGEYKGAGKEKNYDTNKIISWGDTLKGETFIHAVKDKVSIEALGDIKEIVKNAIVFDTAISDPTSKSKMKNTAFMHSLYSIYRKGELEYLIKLYAEEALPNNGGNPFTRAYELKDIEKVADLPNGVLLNNKGLTEDKSATSYNISDLYRFVKRFDKDFTPAREVNPLLLNEDGTPKVWYHQTDSKISEFDLDKQTNSMYDSETPNGIFLKSSDKDIGLQGKSQMNLYPAVSNILQFKNREEAKALRDCDRMCRSRGFFYLRK